MKLTEEQLEKIIYHYGKLDKSCMQASNIGCLDIDGKLYDDIWRAIEAILSIADPHGWVMWYIYDNEMGQKGLKAEVGSKMIKVKNLKTLLEVINS